MDGTDTQRRVRYAAAAGAALVTALYLLIGFGVVRVVDGQPAGVVPPLLIAAALFAALAVLLLTAPRRWVWFAGAALTALVIVGYIAIGADRSPAFEAWGLTVKTVQIALLGALTWLALRRPARSAMGPANRQRLSV
jgi:hypothetical protein